MGLEVQLVPELFLLGGKLPDLGRILSMCARLGVVGARICFVGASPPSQMTTGTFERNAEEASMLPSCPMPSRSSCHRMKGISLKFNQSKT